MKALFTTALLALLMTTATSVRAQDWRDDYLGLPGDNLNLYATMKLFQESETLEGFEMTLNSEDSGINNLDLNGDRRVDYINVTDYVDGNVHNIVLSVALNQRERQDVAVFIVEQLKDGSVNLQLIGDEALYGRNYIIEPYYTDNIASTPNPAYVGRPAPKANVTIVTTSAWEIASWPIVRRIYYPGYLAWHSPWYWGYWPAYYTPWRPLYWHYYYGYHYNWNNYYYAHYRPWNYVRYNRYNDFYYGGVRHVSIVVQKNINKGYYNVSYARPELVNEGRALQARNVTTSNRTRVDSGTSAATGTRLSASIPDNARVKSTSSATARRSDVSVETRNRTEESNLRTKSTSGAVRSETGTTRQETGTTRQESGTTRTRSESGNLRGTEGSTPSRATESTRQQTTEPARRQTPEAGSGVYTRPVTSRSATDRGTAPSVSGESRSTTPSSSSTGSSKVAATPASTRSSSTTTRSTSTSGSTSGRVATPSSSAGSTKVATTPASTRSSSSTTTRSSSTTTRSSSSSSGSSSGRVATPSSSSAGSTKVATTPASTRSSSSTTTRSSSSSSGSSSRGSSSGSGRR